MTDDRVLVLGATGMLGHTAMRYFTEAGLDAYGTIRVAAAANLLAPRLQSRLLVGVDVENTDALTRVFAEVRPTFVVNCIGLVKQLRRAEDPSAALPVNALLPHRLARLCDLVGARLVQISTDCVFSGRRGFYREEDESDALDVYGKSKYLGELREPHTITLRTSMIGHEVGGRHGLLEWFLAQEGQVRGYTRAIFSGLPTYELSRVIAEKILPRPDLSGVYHVAGAPISKFDLLRLFAETYGKTSVVVPDESLAIDRSLNAELFHSKTGYVAPSWPELVRRMRQYQ